LGLPGPRSGAETRHEPLKSLDLGLLTLDRAAERQLARRLLLAPRVPRPFEELAAAGLQLEHARSDGLEEPAVVRHQHDRGIETREVLLQPLERGDVEVVGGLVEQQKIRVAGERPSERGARQLPSGERVERAIEVRVVAEPESAQRGQGAIAPAVAAGVLEAPLRLGVTSERRVVVGSPRHRLLEFGELLLDRDELACAAQDVVAQADVPFAWGTLVVERDLRALGEYQLADVDRRLARQHPEQRRLAGAVASGQRHPVAALELERDTAQERLAGDVLADVGCDHDCHS
jgi:hypothetical protein